MANAPFHLFQAFGIELEYTLVDARTLDVCPVADQVLKAIAALPGAVIEESADGWPGEVAVGPVSFSNELALHVLELKTSTPAPALQGYAGVFQDAVAQVLRITEPMGVRLLPTGMHPWMDPAREMKLWPHGNRESYQAFDRIFDCRGHGWANLQSCHINLPFHGAATEDGEFGRLHAAVRLILPLLPALAASSPFMEGKLTGQCDTRLEVYRHNAARVPSVSGRVVPEPAYTQESYQRLILQPVYDDIAPHDPDGQLQEEWLNARGCIARFSRGTIEIRVLDVQECPAADIAIAAGVSAVVRALVRSPADRMARMRAMPTARLASLFLDVVKLGEHASINDTEYLETLGWEGTVPCTAQDLWRLLLARAPGAGIAASDDFRLVNRIVDAGPLSRRLIHAIAPGPDPARLRELYRELADCLRDGRLFRA